MGKEFNLSKFLDINKDDDLHAAGGGVFIIDVSPTTPGDDIVTPTYVSGVVGGQVVESIETNTEFVTVTVEWDGLATHYTGVVEINGTPVTGVTEIGNTRRYTGSIAIDLAGADLIEAIHTGRRYGAVEVNRAPAAPEITALSFFGGYPGSQTELKAGDTFQIQGTTDVPAVGYEVEGLATDACVPASGSFPSGTSFTLTCTIADRGTTVQDLASRIRVKDSFGSFGSYRSTNELGGNVDGTDTVKVNNLYPTLVFGAITYPATQLALKDSETADVAVTTANLDTILYDSPTSELAITDPTTDNTPKEVTRISGAYNVSTNNLRGTANRAANDATTVAQTIVSIADAFPTIVVTEPAARLITAPSPGEDHVISISSNQLLRLVPTLSAPVGVLSVFSGGVPGASFTATLTLIDGVAQGVHTWTSLVATNLANRVQTVIDTAGANDDTYEVGGFSERDIFFAPFANESALGINVVDVNKLVAVDKDLIAMTYENALDTNNVRAYTITQPANTLNATGNILHWNDIDLGVNINTTGGAFIRIREDA